VTLLEPTLFSLARATVIALATLAVLLAGGHGIRSMPRALRALGFWLVMAALLVPGFALGFVRFDQAMQADPLARETMYCGLIWLRYGGLAVLTLWLMPPAFSPEAMHCYRRGPSYSWWRGIRWELRCWGRGLWLGVALVFLFAFQEFELATTWNMRAWPVALFDAQTGGLALADSLRMTLLPLAVQAVFVGVFIGGLRAAPPAAETSERSTSRASLVLVVVFVGAAMQTWPVLNTLVVLPVTLQSGGTHVLELVPWREIGNGAGLAGAAAIFAWLPAGWIAARRGWRWLLVLPGLFGPMLCGLLLLAVLRLPVLDGMRDTVLAPVVGLVLALLPFALLLRVGLESTRDRAALHCAQTAAARRVVWHLDYWWRGIALLLLFGFAYGDFTINSLLAPPQFTSVSVRLLNLLHYGRNSALSMMFAFAFAIPLAVALLTALAARFYARRCVR
jgi:hypothetical protein